MRFSIVAFAGVALCAAAPALAHHSFSMFDREKSVTLSGTVKEYEWTNPHVWIHMTAPDEKGTLREWGFEMQAIAQDSAGGWRSDSVKPGDKVSIEFHPLKDARAAASWFQRRSPMASIWADRSAAPALRIDG